MDYGSISTTVSILSLLGSALLFFFYRIVDKFIEKKYNITPKGRIDTWDILLDKFMDKGIDKLTVLLPVLKDYKNNNERFSDNIVSPISAPPKPAPQTMKKLDEIMIMLSRLISEVEIVKGDVTANGARITIVEEQAQIAKNVNGSNSVFTPYSDPIADETVVETSDEGELTTL